MTYLEWLNAGKPIGVPISLLSRSRLVESNVDRETLTNIVYETVQNLSDLAGETGLDAATYEPDLEDCASFEFGGLKVFANIRQHSIVNKFYVQMWTYLIKKD